MKSSLSLFFTNLFRRFDSKAIFKTPSDANPADFGFEKTEYGAFEKQGFVLYKSHISNTWTFDRIKKNQPGIIARFDSPITVNDIQYALAFIERSQATI